MSNANLIALRDSADSLINLNKIVFAQGFFLKEGREVYSIDNSHVPSDQESLLKEGYVIRITFEYNIVKEFYYPKDKGDIFKEDAKRIKAVGNNPDLKYYEKNESGDVNTTDTINTTDTTKKKKRRNIDEITKALEDSVNKRKSDKDN